MPVRNYYALRLKKNDPDSDLFKNFSIFELKIRVFDDGYDYLILQFAAVFPA